MAKNWLAYEACEVLLAGTDKEAVSEIGSRFPLFTVAVMRDGAKTLLEILKAVPKVTARVVETGLKDTDAVEADAEAEEVEEEATPKKDAKTSKKVTKKVEAEEDEEEESENDYESMTGAELYKLCCARGISSLCKSRSKTALIEILEKFDAGEIEATKKDAKKEVKETKETKPAKANNKKANKKVEEEDEDWDDEEDEEEVDPYKGKTAKELYKMCVDRDIKTKPKQSADAYAKLLKKADAEAEVEGDEEDEDDDWEI